MKSILILAPFLSVAYGHGLISAAVGANGVTISGFGVTDTVPRNGTSEQPFQLDTPVMKNLVDDPCGATLQGGSINIDKSFQVALAQGKGNLPSLAADGSITMTIHQVNADGGGPYLAQFNTDGTGKDWQEAKVTQQVPGAFGIVRGGPVDSQFTAQLPAGTRCTGGPNRNACLVRINNGGAGNEASLANGAGPFGGCVAVTAATGGNNTNNGNTNTNNNGNNRGGNRGNNNGNNNASQNNRGGRNGGRFRGNQNQGQNRNQAQRGRRHQRDFAEAIDTRKREEFSELLAKRRQLDAEINIKHRELVERQLLTADLIDEIKTATGSAIDIPIDAFAGQVDANPNGGNSTTGANAILTIQQSFDLKKAVQGAIEAALSVLSSAQGVSVDAPGFGVANKLNANDIDQANREAEQALKDGSTTSVNQGNAGVGEPNTSVINELLGAVSDIRTLTLTTVTAGSAATATAAAGGVTGAPSASVTATPAGNANGPQITAASGRNRNRNRRNGLSRLEYVA